MADPIVTVTPWLLTRADELCPVRLRRTAEGEERSHDPVNRARLRDAFVAAAREAHAELRAPGEEAFAGAGAALEPEERAVLDQAARWYALTFRDRPGAERAPLPDGPTLLPRRRVRLGGWMGLVLDADDGGRELRVVELTPRRDPPGDPLDLPAVRTQLLRLAQCGGDGELRVVWADLVSGVVAERGVDLGAELPHLAAWLDERVAVLRARASGDTPVPGADCLGCAHAGGCSAHRDGRHFSRRFPDDPLPNYLSLTPTSVERWRRCPREWYLDTLDVPSSDLDPAPVHGQQVHDLLRLVHTTGSCRDGVAVDDLLTAHAWHDDGRMRAEVARHVRRCPEGADAVGHEITYARFGRRRDVGFMATARLDAVWVHDGILDVHDYKTGRVWHERVADDPAARLQAWIAAPVAAARGLRLRVTYEHLAAEVLDDPVPFEPDEDDLAAIDDELFTTVQTIRAEREFAGVADEETCRRCRYRSICRDSATPGVPTWPRVDAD